MQWALGGLAGEPFAFPQLWVLQNVCKNGVNVCKNGGSLPRVSIHTPDTAPSGLGEVVCSEEATGACKERSSCGNSIGTDGKRGPWRVVGVSIGV